MKNKILSLLALLMAATTGAWAQEPEYIDLTTTDYKTWTLNEMPAYAVGLIVEYETELELANAGSNSTKLSEWDEYEANVTLAGRTLYKDGKWNTLCLPFNVTLAGSPLEGADVRTLSSASLIDGTLTLNFTAKDAVTELVAGTPYIIKWTADANYVDDDEHNIVAPVFSGVTIDNTDRSFKSGDIEFKGNYDAQSFNGESKNILFMGEGSTLHSPISGASIGSCRAYFEIAGGAEVKAFNLNFDGGDTGIEEIVNGKLPIDNSWYSLDGRKLSDKPSRAGVYINNGRKVVIK
jgi:hypothetical protein